MGIITLLLINSTISFIEENNAGNAAAALMARLAPKAKVSNSASFSSIQCAFDIGAVKYLLWKGFNFYFFPSHSFISHVFVVKVLRDGRWSEQDAAVLVPGDVISIKLGDIIPADARLLEGDPLKIDQVSMSFFPFFFLNHISSTVLTIARQLVQLHPALTYAMYFSVCTYR